MDKKIYLSDNKVLEHNKKAFFDTVQLFSNVKEDNIDKEIEKIENNDEYKDTLSLLHFDKGRTIWVELKIEDSYLSSMIYAWMYSKSKFDETELHSLGCSIKTIMFSKPSGYSDDEKEAIKKLYEAAFGNV
jgi:HD-GYP domain-containing protein (c-di-GMP phosphodiesterase class II)